MFSVCPSRGEPEVEGGGGDAVPDDLGRPGLRPGAFCVLQPWHTVAGELKGLRLLRMVFVLSFGQSFRHPGLDYGARCFHLP